MTKFALCFAATLLCASPALAQTTFTSTDVPKSIPDADPTGISSAITVSGIGTITDLNLVFTDLQHTSVADLHIELRAPDNTQVPLVLAFSEGGILLGLLTPDNFINTVFDDQAGTNLSGGTAPYTGSFNINHPSVGNDPLSLFNGLNADGTWTLFVSDRALFDVGTLNGWALQITGNGLAAVPEPSTWAMMLLGFGAVGFAMRRRRQTGLAPSVEPLRLVTIETGCRRESRRHFRMCANVRFPPKTDIGRALGRAALASPTAHRFGAWPYPQHRAGRAAALNSGLPLSHSAQAARGTNR